MGDRSRYEAQYVNQLLKDIHSAREREAAVRAEAKRYRDALIEISVLETRPEGWLREAAGKLDAARNIANAALRPPEALPTPPPPPPGPGARILREGVSIDVGPPQQVKP